MENYIHDNFNKTEFINNIGKDIQMALNENRYELLNFYINNFIIDIKRLKIIAKHDKNLYISLIQMLNTIIANDPTNRVNPSKELHAGLCDGIDDIKFEKKLLFILKKELNKCKKKKDYNKLLMYFNVLMTIFSMQNDRQNKVNNAIDDWNLEISEFKSSDSGKVNKILIKK